LFDGGSATAQIDPHLSNIIELPASVPSVVQDVVGLAAPAIISGEDDAAVPAQSGTGVAMSNVFTTASLPDFHREILVVKMREESLSSDAPMSMSAVHDALSASSLSTGMGALAFYERAGKIKRVVPLRRNSERVTQRPGISAVSALTCPGALRARIRSCRVTRRLPHLTVTETQMRVIGLEVHQLFIEHAGRFKLEHHRVIDFGKSLKRSDEGCFGGDREYQRDRSAANTIRATCSRCQSGRSPGPRSRRTKSTPACLPSSMPTGYFQKSGSQTRISRRCGGASRSAFNSCRR
jgi:hypothetical protein